MIILYIKLQKGLGAYNLWALLPAVVYSGVRSASARLCAMVYLSCL
jgi:hypothetical protein